jgi:uncharacterized membrane protein
MAFSQMTIEKDYEDTVEVLCHTVSFWYRSEKEIGEETKVEEAERRATEMIKEGYISGELNYESEDYSATGWWSIKRS